MKKEEVRKRFDKFWTAKKWIGRLDNGKKQFDLLFSYGLKEHHFLLDVGCGWFRGGVYFIDYLYKGHYYGFDKEEQQLIRGELLLEQLDLAYKKPVVGLVYGHNDLGPFIGERRFDYMLATSVFTHIDPYMANRLFSDVIWFLKDDGLFFASFFKSDLDEPSVGKHHWSRNNEYRHVTYPFQFFKDLAKKYGFSVKYLDIGRDLDRQNWMYFYKEEFVDERWRKV